MKKKQILSTLILTAFVLSGIPALAANSHRNILDSDHGQQKGSQKDSKDEGTKDQGQQKEEDKNDQGQQKASTAARNHGNQDGKGSKDSTKESSKDSKGKQSLRF
mgnify:CR=1 FL=1